MLLGTTKLNNIEILISKALIDSYISDYELTSVNMFREYNARKEEAKNYVEYVVKRKCTPIASLVTKKLQTKIQLLEKINKID